MDKKTRPSICCLQETHFRPKDTFRLKVRGWRTIYHANGFCPKKARVALLISDNLDFKIKTGLRIGRWGVEEDADLTAPADHLDPTHICLNNPENHQKNSRMDSPEPRVDKRPTEEGRKGREAVHITRTGGRDLGQWRGSPPSKAEPPKSDLQKQRGRMERVLTASGT